jgi:hypothetical protein
MAGHNAEPLDFATAERKMLDAARRIYEAEKELETRLTDKADATSEYRKALAMAYTRRRAEGKAQDESKILAQADAADAEKAMLITDGLAKAAGESLENRRGDRASLHKIVEWSMKVAPDGQRQDAGQLRSAA